MELNRRLRRPRQSRSEGSAWAASRSIFSRLEMHPRQRADDLKVAQLFRSDVHQQIFSFRIVAVQALDGILHRGGEFAVCAAELLQQHVAEARIRLYRHLRYTSASLT